MRSNNPGKVRGWWTPHLEKDENQAHYSRRAGTSSYLLGVRASCRASFTRPEGVDAIQSQTHSSAKECVRNGQVFHRDSRFNAQDNFLLPQRVSRYFSR